MERRFFTGEAAETPLYHGSGLGLWLVRLVVTRANGTTAVSDNEPRGNVVSVELPR
jgi:signal transduction histidine kinase